MQDLRANADIHLVNSAVHRIAPRVGNPFCQYFSEEIAKVSFRPIDCESAGADQTFWLELIGCNVKKVCIVEYVDKKKKLYEF